MKTKLWLILGVSLGCIALVALLASVLQSGVEVEAAAVRLGSIREYIDERAKTRLPEIHTITMPFPGRIEPIELTESARVTTDQPVAHVVAKDLDFAVREVEAKLQEVRAAIAQNADTTVEQTAMEQTLKFVESMKALTKATQWQTLASKAAKEYAEEDYRRVERLRQAQVHTGDELEQAMLRRQQSEAVYGQAIETNLSAQWADKATALMSKLLGEYIARKRLQEAILKQQEQQVLIRLEQAELNRDRGTMRSPIDGVVLRRYVTGRRQLAPGTPLLEIGHVEDLEVEADVLSVDVIHAEEGAAVEIYGPAIGKVKVRGIVRRVYPGGFTKISSLGVEQQRVRVLIGFDPGDLQQLLARHHLGVGYDVRVRIFTAERSDALLIPRSALFRGGNGDWQVYAIVGGRAKIKEVKIGLINDEQVQIVKGLSQGEQVILAPESNLEEGTKVSPAG